MLNIDEQKKIKEKMKKTHTYCATFARELGITRQAVNLVLNRVGSSERIEKHLREWYADKEIKRG